MRSMRSLGIVALAVCGLAVAGCGSDDEETSAITTLPTAPAATSGDVTTVTPEPDGSQTTPTTGAATGDDGGTPATETPGENGGDADDSVPSGGVTPSGEASGAEGTAGGDQPTITPGTVDEPASAIAEDASVVDLWCEQARQGAYDAQVGEATSLAITVRGSDDTRTCELPR